MAKKRPLVIANWKMYVETPAEALAYARALRRRARALTSLEVGIAPPYPLLPVVGEALRGSKILLGAQSLSAQESGPHTGEVSAAMLVASRARFVIVGHSERRNPPGGAGEDNDAVHAKLLRATHAGLMPVLCVGEVERDPAGGAHFAYIAEQITSALRDLRRSPPKLVIAYEPVWAIGKSAADAMSPGELQEMVIFIRKTLAEVLGRSAGLHVPILYGGSVEEENAELLLWEGAVAGFLVGHASADVAIFIKILEAMVRNSR
jgi:triosephosphate isomerase